MKKPKFTEEQIAFALKQVETGTRVEEVCRKLGISEATFYNWRKKYGGLGVSELRRLKQLEAENRRLKQMVADLSLDKHMLQDVIKKKALKPAHKRELVEYLRESYRVGVRRAVGMVLLSPSGYYYKAHPRENRAVRQRIREIAETRVRFGMWRIHTLLRREGWQVNHKKTHRIYKEEGLNLRRRRPRRRVAAAHREVHPELATVNECWSMDFVADELFNGRRLRTLTVVDNFSRECLAITVDHALRSDDVVATMEHLKALRGIPKRIKVDNGSEFISKVLDQWAYENDVVLDFSRPGKPTDNPFIDRSTAASAMNV